MTDDIISLCVSAQPAECILTHNQTIGHALGHLINNIHNHQQLQNMRDAHQNAGIPLEMEISTE